MVADAGQQGVPSTRDQAEEGRLERLGFKEVGGDVPVQVIDRDQQLLVGRGRALAVLSPTSRAPIAPGPG